VLLPLLRGYGRGMGLPAGPMMVNTAPKTDVTHVLQHTHSGAKLTKTPSSPVSKDEGQEPSLQYLKKRPQGTESLHHNFYLL
jgi:hypothetical protein